MAIKTLCGAAVAALLVTAPAGAATIYDAIPNPLPPNLPSLGYEATSTAAFGDLIQFASGSRSLTSVDVTMSNWAMESTYEPVGTSTGYSVPLTLTLYNVDNSGSAPAVGSTIASRTIDPTILWRPEATASCSTGWLAGDGNCYNGLAQNVAFDFSGVTVPDQIIFGLSFNTENYGTNPTGTAGPYNSLNFGLATSGPSVGTEVTPGTLFWDTTYPGVTPTGVLSQNSGWAPYVPAIQFQAADVPEPASISVLAIGLVGLGLMRRTRRGGSRSIA